MSGGTAIQQRPELLKIVRVAHLFKRATASPNNGGMRPAAEAILPRSLQKMLLAGVGAAIALVILGRLLVPGMSFRSTIGALFILATYGGMAAICPSRLHRQSPHILCGAIIFGLLAGAVFAGEIILEYILLPTDNTRYGLAEFGLVFALYTASSLRAGLRSRSVRNAILTAVACAFIASLIWAIATLSVFYVFRGSPRQELVMRAEGNYADFARSGMTDFSAFVMEDFMGAIFFHLLLGPLMAAVLGVFGGAVGKSFARLRA